MSERVANELADYINQAVAGVPASARRKQDMQAELVAHLLAIYGEERERAESDQAALLRAQDRFGTPSDLQRELTAAVPSVERLICLIGIKGRFMKRWLWLLSVPAVFVGLGLVCPAIAHLSRGDHITRSDLYPLGLVTTLLVLGLILSLGGLGVITHRLVRAVRPRTG